MADCSQTQIALGIGGVRIPLHSHIACLWETEAEFAAALGFLVEGLRGTDHCVILGHDKANLQACRLLGEQGLDTEALRDSGRLALIGAAVTGEALLESIAASFAAQMEAGATVLRLIGNIGWLEPGWPKIAELVDMEAQVNAAAAKFPCVILCMYDLRTIPALILRHGALETHYWLLRDGSLSQNPSSAPTGAASSEPDARSETFAELERQSEAVRLYRGIFANMPEGVVIVRLEPSEPELSPVVVDLNPAARDISASRRAPAEFKGLRLCEYFPGLINSELRKLCYQTWQTGKAADIGEAGGAGGASYRVWIFPLQGNYLGVMFTDISEQKRTEQALLSLRNLSTALQSTVNVTRILDQVLKESVAIVAAEAGIVALCSDNGLSVYRYLPQGQPAPLDLTASSGPGCTGRVILHTVPYLSNAPLSDPRVDHEAATRHRVGSALSSPIRDAGGAMIGFLEMHNKTDASGFTEFDLQQLTSVARIAAHALTNAMAFQKISQMGIRLRESEAEIKLLLSRVRQDAAELEGRVAERTAQLQEMNEELDTFAYSVSHDLRAPLRAIQGYAEALLEDRGDPQRDQFLARILTASQGMDQLIQDLLSYSRLTRQEIMLQTVHLGEAVQEAAEKLRLSSADQEYHLEISGPLPSALGNHAVLVQVVLNLLSNGVKFVPAGVIPELRVWAERADNAVRLFVQDNGIGIAPESQERIFKVFERLHGVESYPGTGIGLAIARKAVARLGGRIGVESRPGEGSRFWIELKGGKAV